MCYRIRLQEWREMGAIILWECDDSVTLAGFLCGGWRSFFMPAFLCQDSTDEWLLS